MILHFVKIMGLLRFSKTYSGKSPSNTLRDTNLFVGGDSKNKYQNMLGFGGSKFEKLSKFQQIEIWKIICLRMIPYFFLYSLKHFGDGVKGQILCKFWKFQKSSKK